MLNLLLHLMAASVILRGLLNFLTQNTQQRMPAQILIYQYVGNDVNWEYQDILNKKLFK